MAKKKEDLISQIDDTVELPEMVEVPMEPKQEEPKARKRDTEANDYKERVSCLRNERVTIKLIPRGNITNPKHVLYGGMAEGATFTVTVPKLTSGMYVNVLTDAEKDYLEEVLNLEKNALSIYKRTDNFWDDSNPNGISKVRLTKQDNYLDLSSPEDYIKYKILLANKNIIAPSMQELQDRPKASYRFVVISEGEEARTAKKNMSATMMCYKEFGKIEEDIDTLRVIIETIGNKPVASTTKLDFLQTKANEFIQSDSKLFLKVITDPMLPTKVLIRKALEQGHIYKRNDLYYLSDNTPMCEPNEESTLNIAAKYLNNPRHQTVKFALEAKIK